MIFINLQSKTHPIRHHYRETHGISANLKIDGFGKVLGRFWGGFGEVIGRFWEVLGGFGRFWEVLRRF